MSAKITSDNDEVLARENKELRERVAFLEDELEQQAARTNEAVARLEERVYWLDRWHLDLNKVMEKPGASQFRALIRAIRAPYRWIVNFSRKHRP